MAQVDEFDVEENIIQIQTFANDDAKHPVRPGSTVSNGTTEEGDGDDL